MRCTRTVCLSPVTLFLVVCVALTSDKVHAQDSETPAPRAGDAALAEYFRLETARLTAAALADIHTLEDWTSQRELYREQLLEMLGLSPWPEKTPLDPVVTGTVDHEGFTVERLHFQSMPGLYVTGNLYVPKGLTGKAPTILYVCGHAQMREGDVSFGNKTGYQHHGAWFARHGYVCLTIDTLQLGEIQGIHHGTYREGMWWWNSRGYCPAGVEAWNCVRALDYLESRPEVDATKFGVTGRSGGGAYSWWIAAIDERIQCAVPVAGITSLHNHVVDGCVEGHCDCMYFVNTYEWDFPLVAALVAPRPLLISNTDKDRIFPLEGVVDVHRKVRDIYELYGAGDKLGLQITEGPHKDTQELHIHAFVWMNRFLKGENPPIDDPALKLFEPAQLRVFADLPGDELNTRIQESFVEPARFDASPADADAWRSQRETWMTGLREKVFRGWPDDEQDAGLELRQLGSAEHDGIAVTVHEFTGQEPFRLPLIVAHRADRSPEDLDLVVLNLVDQNGWDDVVATLSAAAPDALESLVADLPEQSAEEGWDELAAMLKQQPWGMAWTAPRGVGPTEWTPDERERTQIRRRFMLLGQTLDGMRVYDARRGIQTLRKLEGFGDRPLWLQAEGDAAVWSLYASLFEPDVAVLDLHALPHSHQSGPDLLNVLRVFDLPQAVALAAETSRVRIYNGDRDVWQYPLDAAEALGWSDRQLQIRDLPAPGGQ